MQLCSAFAHILLPSQTSMASSLKDIFTLSLQAKEEDYTGGETKSLGL